MEHIKGSCEYCGHDYNLKTVLAYPIHCPHCGKETENFDTVDGSLMAPSVIALKK